jgi:hypothetical protein
MPRQERHNGSDESPDPSPIQTSKASALSRRVTHKLGGQCRPLLMETGSWTSGIENDERGTDSSDERSSEMLRAQDCGSNSCEKPKL